jgi:hypothetical protein
MTALNAAILFNNSTGSDTQSSGSSAGANVYGSGASTTSASAQQEFRQVISFGFKVLAVVNLALLLLLILERK